MTKMKKKSHQHWLSTELENFKAMMYTEITRNDPKKWRMKAKKFSGRKEEDNGGGEGKFQLPIIEAILRREEGLDWQFFLGPKMKQFSTCNNLKLLF